MVIRVEPGDCTDWRALDLAERRADRAAARAFVNACQSGDSAALLHAVDLINHTSIDGWRLAMKGAGRLSGVDQAIRDAFLHVWIESKTLARRVGDKRALAAALSHARKLSRPCIAFVSWRAGG